MRHCPSHLSSRLVPEDQKIPKREGPTKESKLMPLLRSLELEHLKKSAEEETGFRAMFFVALPLPRGSLP